VENLSPAAQAAPEKSAVGLKADPQASGKKREECGKQAGTPASPRGLHAVSRRSALLPATLAARALFQHAGFGADVRQAPAEFGVVVRRRRRLRQRGFDLGAFGREPGQPFVDRPGKWCESAASSV
jgi:hypothetical protein